MGHHQGSNDTIVPLIDRLNRNPIGLPDSDTLRRVLAILFSADEAFIASRFPLQEATLMELSRATGWTEDKIEPVLDTMAEKGLIMDLAYGGNRYYLLMPGLIGFFEFTFMKRRQDLPVEELAQLMHEYMFEDPDNAMGREMFGSATPLTRALVHEEHIPVESVVTTWESAREIVKNAGYGAIGLCYCRHKKEHLGSRCDKGAPTEEICISLGTAARFMARRGFAEKRSTEELLAVLDRSRSLNLTHITDNIRHKPSFICNCCSCCCELLGGVRQGFPDGVAKAPFTLQIDVQTCVGCGLCWQSCNVGAIEPLPVNGEKSAGVAEDRCLGCGACISTCATESLSLVPVSRTLPPERKRDLFSQILKEKKRYTPHLVASLKKAVRRKLGV
jgi:ferredoxin